MSHEREPSNAAPLPPPLGGATVLERDDASYRELAARNVERFVGVARVPVGLAGPLEMRGEHAQGTVHVPLATTEGQLVASTCRGMKVLNESGGARARVTRRGGTQRAPVFRFATPEGALALARALEADSSWLSPVVASTTRHGRLASVRCWVIGRYAHVRISIDPGDAAGQNMVSIAAAACARAIVDRFPGIERSYMEGGMSGEKVPSRLNALEGRGLGAVAWAEIPRDVLRRVTKAEPEDLLELLRIYTSAAMWCGQTNTHASLVNVIPALFIATGQDVACAAESSMAQNVLELDEARDVLRWEVVVPNLMIGTVGGGTALPTQRECLAILGCDGPGNVERLAEITAATALANEISFWSAIVAGAWVDAHAALRSRSPNETGPTQA